MEKEKLEIFKRLKERKQQLEAYEKERQRASLSLHDQDSDMPDIDNETFPGMKDVFYSNTNYVIFIFHMISHDDFVVQCDVFTFLQLAKAIQQAVKIVYYLILKHRKLTTIFI